jgi:serralysin
MYVVLRHGSALCLVMLLATMVLLLPANAGAAVASGNSDTTVYLPFVEQQPSIEQEVVELVNQQRRENGCLVDLTVSTQLSAAAYEHSRDMALNNFFSHDGSDGSDMVARANNAGYSFHMLAENIQAGPTDPQMAVENWMNSAGHRANILNCNLLNIGIGYYFQPDDQPIPQVGGPFFAYWTQVFGTP